MGSWGELVLFVVVIVGGSVVLFRLVVVLFRSVVVLFRSVVVSLPIVVWVAAVVGCSPTVVVLSI